VVVGGILGHLNKLAKSIKIKGIPEVNVEIKCDCCWRSETAGFSVQSLAASFFKDDGD